MFLKVSGYPPDFARFEKIFFGLTKLLHVLPCVSENKIWIPIFFLEIFKRKDFIFLFLAGSYLSTDR